MVYEVKTIDGVKTKVPLTNSSGVVAGGNPIGTIISTYKKIKPANYLYCDGSTFNPEIYPGLFLYLGTNVLPDYRECAMVGAEKNTTNVFDSTETDPSTGLPGTQSHDVYTEGEFKDDQFQGHTHTIKGSQNGPGASGRSWANNYGTEHLDTMWAEYSSDGTNGTPRIGSTTHGKQKAVFYYIKAVDGVDITDEDAFIGEVKDYVDTEVASSIATTQSYSTTEQLTGGKWIDGKPIYRQVVSLNITSGTWFDVCTIRDKSTIVRYSATYRVKNETSSIASPTWMNSYSIDRFRVNFSATIGWVDIIVEYTKVAD